MSKATKDPRRGYTTKVRTSTDVERLLQSAEAISEQRLKTKPYPDPVRIETLRRFKAVF